MPEHLTEKDWKDQLKKHKDVKDTGISEPLRDYEKYAKKEDFSKAVAALKKLATKIESAKKDYKKNTELCKHLASMASEAADEQETLEKKLNGEEVEEGPDKALNQALKKAKTGQMYFAVIVNGNNGKLLMDRAKISATDVGEAKKKLGGGQELRGLCAGEDGTHVFYFRKEPAGTMASLLKTVAKNDAGLAIKVECRVKGDLGDTGEGDDLVAQVGDVKGKPTVDSPKIKAYESANLKWTQAKSVAEKSIQDLQTALVDSGDQQAIAVARGLSRVIGQLPDVGLSLSRLTNIAKGGEPNAVKKATEEARDAISSCVSYLSKDALVSDVEKNPFVKVDLKKSLGTVLAEAKKTCT